VARILDGPAFAAALSLKAGNSPVRKAARAALCSSEFLDHASARGVLRGLVGAATDSQEAAVVEPVGRLSALGSDPTWSIVDEF
jgi:hypothetical protein